MRWRLAAAHVRLLAPAAQRGSAQSSIHTTGETNWMISKAGDLCCRAVSTNITTKTSALPNVSSAGSGIADESSKQVLIRLYGATDYKFLPRSCEPRIPRSLTCDSTDANCRRDCSYSTAQMGNGSGKPEDVKSLMMGLDNGGKTTMFYKLTLGEVVDTTPSIGI